MPQKHDVGHQKRLRHQAMNQANATEAADRNDTRPGKKDTR